MTIPPDRKGPTPEQLAAGPPPPTISVLDQRRITTTPVPGQRVDRIAITYRIPPAPARILFVPLEDLPSWAFRKTNPGKDVPEALEAKTDDILRRLIRERPKPEGPGPRKI